MVRDYDIEGFLEELSSKSPVPGGGGASALAGALGTALGAMVCSLTIGKKKYATVEEDIRKDLSEMAMFREMFLRLADKDEEVFLPLSKAYGMPRDTEAEKAARESFMEQALLDATLVPLSIMESVTGALEILKDIAEKGSKLAISDAGVSSCYFRTALTGARYNVLINLKSMKNPERREQLSERCGHALTYGLRLCDEVDKTVRERI